MEDIKRLFYIVLICFFCLSCGKKDNKTIVFAVGGAPNEIYYWEGLIREFEKIEGIKVNILRQPTDTDQRRHGLLIPLKAKQEDPDIFLMDIAWIAQFAASDWLESLDSYCKDENNDCRIFFDNVINLADRYRGNLVALPIYIDAGLLYYRKDILKNFGYSGPPDTWVELVDWSVSIQEKMRKTNPNFYGFLWQGAQYEGLICNFLEFAGSNGGGIFLQDERISIKTLENIQSAQFMYDLIYKHKISPPNTYTEMKEEEVRTFFQQGNALFSRNWPYAWSLYQMDDSPIKDKVGIASLPFFPSGKRVSTLGGWHIGISKYSDAKYLSWKFLKFIVSFESQKSLALGLGWNPARKDVYIDKDVTQKMPHFTALKKVFENAHPRPNLPYYSQISEVLQEYLNAIIAGKISPETGLENAEIEVQKITKKYNES